MEARQELVNQSIKHALAVLRLPAFDIPALTGLRADLQKASARIDQLTATQAGNRSSFERDRIVALRKELRLRMLRISRDAVIRLDGLPGIKEDVRVPHANASSAELLEAKTRLVKNLRPHMKTLHKAGLPKDSIPRLEAVAKAFAAKLANTDTYINRRSRATSSLPEALAHGRKLVSAIDSVARLEFADNATVLHVWARAKRIPLKLGRPKKKPRGDDDAGGSGPRK
jgi:hypothetical protein